MREAVPSAYLIMTWGSIRIESSFSKQSLKAWGEAVRAPFELFFFLRSFQEWQFMRMIFRLCEHKPLKPEH